MYDSQEFADLIGDVFEHEKIDNKNLHYENFINNIISDVDGNFVWEKSVDNIKHTFVIINSNEEDSLGIGFAFEDEIDFENSQVGRIDLDLQIGNIEVSLDDEYETSLNYDEDTVKEFFVQFIVAIEKSIDQN